MGGFGYKLLGMVVFKGAKLYLRRRYGGLRPSRRKTVAGLFAVAAAGVAVAALRGRCDSSAR